MQDRPVIKTAIPRHRYQIGDHSAALLGDVESGDARDYRYILAFVPASQPEPVLYVCAERTPPAERADGAYRLRVIGEFMTDLVDTNDRWGDLETFAAEALDLGARLLGLRQAQVRKLM